MRERDNQTIPYPRCGRITPLLDPSAEVMCLLKCRPYEEMSFVNWCGHKVDYIWVPKGDSGCQLILMLAEER